MTPPRFDVALTFAGEQREYVRDVATVLRARGITYFFDEERHVELWGRNMVDVADTTYRLDATYAAMFVSAEYKAKVWPNFERQSAQSRAMAQAEPYILPIRFDDTELPGLLPTIIYVDARTTEASEVGAMIAAKVVGTRAADDGVIEDRGPCWEYLLFIDELKSSVVGYDRDWRDFLAGYARPVGRLISMDEVVDDLYTRLSAAEKVIANISRAMSPLATEAAFGPPGVPGDAEAIRHLANRLVDAYASLLAWAADARGVLVPDVIEEAYESLALMVGTPLRQIRAFVDRLDDETRPVVEALRRGEEFEKVELHFTLELTLEPQHGERIRQVLDAALQRR